MLTRGSLLKLQRQHEHHGINNTQACSLRSNSSLGYMCVADTEKELPAQAAENKIPKLMFALLMYQ